MQSGDVDSHRLVLSGDRIQYAVMLAQQVFLVSLTAQCQNAQTIQKHLFAAQDVGNTRIQRGPCEGQVELIIKMAKICRGALLDRLFLPFEIVFQFYCKSVGNADFTQPANGRYFQRLAQKAGFENLAGVQFGDKMATARPGGDKPALAQLLQSLTHRGPAGAKSGTDVSFRESLAWRQFHSQDHALQSVEYLDSSWPFRVDFGKTDLGHQYFRQLALRWHQFVIFHGPGPLVIYKYTGIQSLHNKYAGIFSPARGRVLGQCNCVEGFAMNIALIGLGMVAATHVKAIQASTAGINLRGVYGRSETKVAEFIAEHLPDDDGSLRRYKSLEEIAADGEIDFAIVATPPNARDTILHQLVAGKKHILLEKPIERSSRAASRFVKVCEEAGVTLGVVFQHRARAVARELKELVDSGATGPIRVVEIVVPWWRPQSYYDEPGRGTYKRDGGGVLISQAIHTMDLALSFVGSVITVQATTRRSAFHDMEAEDFVTAGMDFANGAIGSLMASTASYPGRAESITLHCDEVSARLQSGKLELDWRDGRHEVSGEDMATGGGADPMAFTHEWHQTMIEDFADAIRSGRPPLAPGREALAVHYLIDAINRSSYGDAACELSVNGYADD